MSNLGALDMALDDVISQNRSNNKRNNSNNKRNSTRGGSGGISKNRSSGGRSSPYNGARPSRNNNSRPVDNRSNSRSNNSLVVANLHFNVTEKDLYDLFGQIGALKRAFLHIGPNGRSAGIADVVFVNGNDAQKARNTYNNVELDGRPMHISTASIVNAVSSAPSNNRRGGNLRGSNNSRRDNHSSSSRGGRGGNRRENRPKPSQQDLDAEMDSYMGANNEDTQMN